MLDQTGLLYYHARYYDPTIARFLSADTVVPGNASGGMGGIAHKPLTVAFHEPGFNATLGNENDFGPWFTLSDKQKEQLGSPFGPQNPQNLNRYSCVLNNPMRYTDPSGHFGKTHTVMGTTYHLTNEEVQMLHASYNGQVSDDAQYIGFLVAFGLKAAEAQLMLEALKVALAGGESLSKAIAEEVIKTLARTVGYSASALLLAATILTLIQISDNLIYHMNNLYGNRGVDIWIGYGGGP